MILNKSTLKTADTKMDYTQLKQMINQLFNKNSKKDWWNSRVVETVAFWSLKLAARSTIFYITK